MRLGEQSTEAALGRTYQDVRAQGTGARVPLRTRCPLCHTVVELPGPVPLGKLSCAACGIQFRWSPRANGLAPSSACGAQASARPARDELERWLSGEPLRPRELSLRQRCVRFCRNRPWLAAAAGLGLVVIIAVAVGLAQTTVRLALSERARRQAEAERQTAEQQAAERARQAQWHERQAAQALAARQEAEERLRLAELRRQEAEQQRRQVEAQQAQAAHEARLALARQLAEDSRRFLLSHPARSLFLATQAVQARLSEGLPADPQTEQLLRDALAQMALPSLARHEQAILCAAISPDGRWLATGGRDQTVRLCDLQTTQAAARPRVLHAHRRGVVAVAFTPDRAWLISAGQDGQIVLWDMTAADRLPDHAALPSRILHGSGPAIRAVALSPDGQWLLAGGGDGASGDCAARIWRLPPAGSNFAQAEPQGPAMVFRGHERPILCAVFSGDGRWAITAGEDKTIRLWDLRAKYPAAEQIVWQGHENWVNTLAASPDGRWLASGSYDGTVRLWDLARPSPATQPRVLGGHRGWVAQVVFSPDGRLLASGGFDRTVRIWKLDTAGAASEPLLLAGHTGRITALAFSPDGRWLVSGGYDATARLWDLRSSDPVSSVQVLRGHIGPINAVAISKDSQWLVTAAGESLDVHDNTARLWDLRLEGLLESARAVAGQELTTAQQEQLLLDAAQRSAALR